MTQHSVFGGTLKRAGRNQWIWSDGTPESRATDLSSSSVYNFRCCQRAGGTHVEVLRSAAHRERDVLGWVLDGVAAGKYPQGMSGDHTGPMMLTDDGIERMRIESGEDPLLGNEPIVHKRAIPRVALVPIREWDAWAAEHPYGATWPTEVESEIFAKARSLGWNGRPAIPAPVAPARNRPRKGQTAGAAFLKATTVEELPQTLLDAVRYFSDLSVCHDYMRAVKWPDGVIRCPKCGGESCSEIRTRPGRLKCNRNACQKQFSYKVGTIFEDSPLGLDKWFVAVWSIANAKNGISSHELSRDLGVTQKTAWFMLHRIREAMKTGTFRKLTGTVESDETFIGGESRNMHKHVREKKIRGRGAVGKVAVQGVMERGGDVRTFVVADVEGETLRANVIRHVEAGARVFTDSATAYTGLIRRFVHSTIDHARQEWVRGEVHTNSVENFWTLLKRSLKGTWTHVASFHLHRYCEEQGWRFNNRRTGDGSRFWTLLRNVVGRRLTYRRLAAVGDACFMGIE